MKLRFPSDVRTLLWAFGLFPAVALLPIVQPALALWIVPLGLYTGFCAGVFAHNHNHCPVFRGRRMNGFFSAWLSVFYGYPTFAWIPTHNRNHHTFMNRPGDATITWRYSRRNTWSIASSYFFVSAWWQRGLIRDYVGELRAHHPRRFRAVVAQVLAVAGAHAAALATAVALHGARRGGLAYLSGWVVPAAMGLWGMIFINFIQHVHCDPWSAHDHSRNFVGRLGNWLVFNNGFHTVHHEHPGAHWSKLPALHAAIANQIHPDLCQRSIVGYCLRSYLGGLFVPALRTRQIGRAAYDVPAASP